MLTLYPLEGSVSKGFTPSVRPEAPSPLPSVWQGASVSLCLSSSISGKPSLTTSAEVVSHPSPLPQYPFLFIYHWFFFFFSFSWGRFFFYSSRKKSMQKHTKETQKNMVKVPQTTNSSRHFFFFFLLHHFPHNIFFNWFSIGGQLLYNIVLASTIYQHESVRAIPMSPPSWTSPPIHHSYLKFWFVYMEPIMYVFFITRKLECQLKARKFICRVHHSPPSAWCLASIQRLPNARVTPKRTVWSYADIDHVYLGFRACKCPCLPVPLQGAWVLAPWMPLLQGPPGRTIC